ncbi:MAG: hypothetical protein D6685_11605 [Bacteroidetes bacterium]|nr:hypothetical protein AWN76_011435 [Rhodothermaceae bacterium RA]RMH58897.1 MAG: hypothetical protein D6685_11605 [Bacteroidota bacterium]
MSIRTSVLRMASVALLALLVATPAQAQLDLKIGPRLGYDVGDIEEAFLGVEARVGLPVMPVEFNGSFDYYFMEENVNFWSVHVGGLYALKAPGVPVAPYVGAGLDFSRLSVDVPEFDTPFGTFGGDSTGNTEVGLGLIGGVSFAFGPLNPFVQAQISLGDYDLYTLSAGLLFGL